MHSLGFAIEKNNGSFGSDAYTAKASISDREVCITISCNAASISDAKLALLSKISDVRNTLAGLSEEIG